MNFYEAGDTIIFQEKQYLIMKVVTIDSKRYLVLAGEKESFELLVCLEKEENYQSVLELVSDPDLKRKVLFEIA